MEKIDQNKSGIQELQKLLRTFWPLIVGILIILIISVIRGNISEFTLGLIFYSSFTIVLFSISHIIIKRYIPLSNIYILALIYFGLLLIYFDLATIIIERVFNFDTIFDLNGYILGFILIIIGFLMNSYQNFKKLSSS